MFEDVDSMQEIVRKYAGHVNMPDMKKWMDWWI